MKELARQCFLSLKKVDENKYYAQYSVLLDGYYQDGFGINKELHPNADAMAIDLFYSEFVNKAK